MSPTTSDKKRVCVISSAPAPYRIGLFEKLAKRPEVDLKVYFLGKTCGVWDWDEEMGGDFPHEFLELPPLLPKDRYSFWLHPQLNKVLHKDSFDVVVIGGYFIPSLVLAVALCRMKGIPYIMWSESHGGMQRSGIKKMIRPLLVGNILKGAGAHFAVGSAAKNLIVESGVPAENVFLVLNSPDVQGIGKKTRELRASVNEWKKTKKLGPGPVGLFVGRMVEDKGIADLLGAYDRLNSKGLSPNLVMVGRGPLLDATRERVAKDKWNNVLIEGFVPPDKVIEYYAAADFLILPSHHEPFGAVVQEALAAGLPVIASDAVGAVADLVTENETGFVFPTGDVARLGDLMEKLYTEKQTASGMAARCVERAVMFDHNGGVVEFIRGIFKATEARG